MKRLKGTGSHGSLVGSTFLDTHCLVLFSLQNENKKFQVEIRETEARQRRVT